MPTAMLIQYVSELAASEQLQTSISRNLLLKRQFQEIC
jgi:hypothetical protein